MKSKHLGKFCEDLDTVLESQLHTLDLPTAAAVHNEEALDLAGEQHDGQCGTDIRPKCTRELKRKRGEDS